MHDGDSPAARRAPLRRPLRRREFSSQANPSGDPAACGRAAADDNDSRGTPPTPRGGCPNVDVPGSSSMVATLFRPARALMGRLTYTPKIVAVVLVMAVP